MNAGHAGPSDKNEPIAEVDESTSSPALSGAPLAGSGVSGRGLAGREISGTSFFGRVSENMVGWESSSRLPISVPVALAWAMVAICAVLLYLYYEDPDQGVHFLGMSIAPAVVAIGIAIRRFGRSRMLPGSAHKSEILIVGKNPRTKDYLEALERFEQFIYALVAHQTSDEADHQRVRRNAVLAANRCALAQPL